MQANVSELLTSLTLRAISSEPLLLLALGTLLLVLSFRLRAQWAEPEAPPPAAPPAPRKVSGVMAAQQTH